MSIADQIARIEDCRNRIRDKLVSMGRANSTYKLEDLTDSIEDIIVRGAVSATVQEGATYTIPEGYHNGSGTVAGIAGGGSYNLQSKTVTPTKKQQSVTPDDGYYGMSDVTVAPIPDAYQNVSSVTAGAADVLAGKVVVLRDGSVTTGTMVNYGNVEKYLDATANNSGYRIPAGYHAGAGHVSIRLESKTATPSKSQQSVKPTDGKVLSQVVVEPIPAQYQDVSGVTATSADILSGKKARNADGDVIGSMTNNGAVSGKIDGINSTSYVIPKGYHNGNGTVSLSADIEDALAAI